MSGRRKNFLVDLNEHYKDWTEFRRFYNYPEIVGVHKNRIKEHFDDGSVIGIVSAVCDRDDKAADASISAMESEEERIMLEGFAHSMHFGFCRVKGRWIDGKAADADGTDEYGYVIFGDVKYIDSVRKLLLAFCKRYGKGAFLFILKGSLYSIKADGSKQSEGKYDGSLELLGKKYAELYRGRRRFADEGTAEPYFEFKRFERYSPIRRGFDSISDAASFHASLTDLEKNGENMFRSLNLSERRGPCAPDRDLIKIYEKLGRTVQDIIYYDTSVLEKYQSGLPVNISVDSGIWIKLGYSARILFQNDCEQRADVFKMVPMSLSDNPEIIPRAKRPYKISLSDGDIAKIKEFVKANLVFLKRLSDPGDRYDMRDFYDDMIKAE